MVSIFLTMKATIWFKSQKERKGQREKEKERVRERKKQENSVCVFLCVWERKKETEKGSSREKGSLREITRQLER